MNLGHYHPPKVWGFEWSEPETPYLGGWGIIKKPLKLNIESQWLFQSNDILMFLAICSVRLYKYLTIHVQ